MIWLVLEGVLALSLFVFIIWWTLPRKRKDDSASRSKSEITDSGGEKEDQGH
jgi:hypothetical protein